MVTSKFDFARYIARDITQLERYRRRYINERLKDKEYQGLMYSAILFLKFNAGACQDKLCAEIMIDKGNGTRLCRQMEDLGYIRREQSKIDRRQNLLYLTELGEEQIPFIEDVMVSWREMITAGFTDEECTQLLDLLGKMVDNLHEIF